jgi:hypothetical protein
MKLISKQNHLSYEMQFEKNTLIPSPETSALILACLVMPFSAFLSYYIFSHLRETYTLSNSINEMSVGLVLLSPILSLYFPCKLYKHLTK